MIFDNDNHVKMFITRWYVNGKPMNINLTEPVFYFSEKEALQTGQEYTPVRGRDYTDEDVNLELKAECISCPPPDAGFLMNLILVHQIKEGILALTKKNCKACQVGSDSQADHCRNGNCLDDTIDYIDVYFKKARLCVQPFQLMAMFDEVHRKIGAKPMFSKELAKCAHLWIPDEKVIEQIHNIC